MVVIHGLGDLGVSEERLSECKTTFLSCNLFSKRGTLFNNMTSAKNKKKAMLHCTESRQVREIRVWWEGTFARQGFCQGFKNTLSRVAERGGA